MIRIHGDRNSLIAALLLHWSEHQIGLPLLREDVMPKRKDHRLSTSQRH